MRISLSNCLILALLALAVAGCAGVQTFPNAARAGDTVALAAGWKHKFSRDNITVTITPSVGNPIVYAPGDPAVRASINFYPDPVSGLVVGTETGQGEGATYGSLINNNFTDQDRDWWQTTVFIDLPASLPLGTTYIDISNPEGESAWSSVEIVDGVGSPAVFDAELNGPLTEQQLASLERADHYVISFDGTTLPYAIQVDFTHDPDAANGGTGVAHVVNTRGDIKNVAWTDDGYNLRVIVTPAKGVALSNMVDFKFYVAGGITGLTVSQVKAFDENGNPVAGVTATVR